ncbi:MAG: polysaccharide biosynthesis protein, partial [Candidatus Ruminococcus intestinipullorum]|nr:polysaccharide biosynthesis protein [Candidatus Ruminococcus intestinipullorum]
MKRLIRKWDLSIVYKILLVILDIVFINLSSFLALWIRFNMKINEIPWEYSNSVIEVAVINTIVTIILFAIFKLYTSLWRFASIKELVYIIEACSGSI